MTFLTTLEGDPIATLQAGTSLKLEPIVTSRLNLSFVGGGEDADIRPEHDTVAYGHYAAVEYDSAMNEVSFSCAVANGVVGAVIRVRTYLKLE